MADEKTEQTAEETETAEEETPKQEEAKKDEQSQADEKVYTKKDFDKQAYKIRRQDKENKELKAKVFEYEKQFKDFEALKAENVELKAKEQRRGWRDKYSKEFSVPAEVLRGDTEDEIKEHAEQLSNAGVGKFKTDLGDNSHAQAKKQDDSMHGQIVDAIKGFKENR